MRNTALPLIERPLGGRGRTIEVVAAIDRGEERGLGAAGGVVGAEVRVDGA